MELLAVNYHYVDEEDKYVAGIYPASPRRLAAQIDLIRKRYTFISGAQLSRAVRGEEMLPGKSCILTFDDSLKSQYENALPVLEAKEVPALFFFLTGHLASGKGYTLHKIHYLLSQTPEEVLLERALDAYERLTGRAVHWGGAERDAILSWYRYDNEAAARFKYLLNHHLPDDTVEKIVDVLFEELSEVPERKFVERFFLSSGEMRALASHPLACVGIHTHTHKSIAKHTAEAVRNDICTNAAVLSRDIGVRSLDVISYPFGKITGEMFDAKVRPAACDLGLACGFSIEKKVNTDFEHPFLLGRFSSNDIPGGKQPIVSL